jgi:multidrug efflux pump subunit AcrA (membrane-fusion protein)
LSEEQIDGILAKRTLLSHLLVSSPVQDGEKPSDGADQKSIPPLQVETLNVEQGQYVKAGDLLCVLADYSELQIEGKAFEQDMPALDNAAAKDWSVTAVLAGQGRGQSTVPGLKILSVANTVDPESRALLFHVQLPNQLIRDRQTSDGRRFCGWQFKPGQRLQLLVPVERWENRIVLPIDAVVQDGAESYVFEKNGDHFDRRAVRVVYRDPRSVVLANDGTVAPGKTVIVAGAYQVHLAMKNKSSGPPDPHAGHSH